MQTWVMVETGKQKHRIRAFLLWCRPRSLADAITYGGVIFAALTFLYYSWNDAYLPRSLIPLFLLIFLAYALWSAHQIRKIFGQPSAMSGVPQVETVRPALSRLVEDANIEWSGGERVVFRGKIARAAEDIRVYVEYGSASGGMMLPSFAANGSTGPHERMRIATLEHYTRGESFEVTLATVAKVDGNQLVLQWGEPKDNNTKVGITWAHYFGRVVFGGPGNFEESHPFAVISRSLEHGDPSPPLFVGPNPIASCWGDGSEAKKHHHPVEVTDSQSL